MPSKYGWKPDLPDHRDIMYRAEVPPSALPACVDLRKTYTLAPVYDQKDLGSCVGNGTGFIWQYVLQKQSLPAPTPARLFIYYNARLLEGTVSLDAGAYIRDGLTVLNKYGCCDEKLWPYDVTKFAKKPVAKAYKEALKHQALQYSRVIQDLPHIKACLASGFPIVMGFSVYESFESQEAAKTGIVQLPNKAEKSFGGHCVVIVGYDDSKQIFICRNSWGEGWGDKGYFYVPYAYFLNSNLADDFWTLRMVEGA